MRNNRCCKTERADMRRWPLRAILGLMAMAICLIWSNPGMAGELRPYNPPSAQPEIQQLFSAEAPSGKTPPAVEEEVYVRFLKAVQAMEAEKKKALVIGITEKRDTAVRSGELEEAKHYMRLLDTIEKPVGGIQQ